MEYIPCHKRTFLYEITVASLYAPYLSWLKHLSERLGVHSALSVWENTFNEYDDTLLMDILSTGWRIVKTNETSQVEGQINEVINGFFPATDLDNPGDKAKRIVENTPPISQIRKFFSYHTFEKEITAYDALHIRFDGYASLAEALIKKYGKQGELIVYDLVVENRLARDNGETGTVEEFISSFVAEPVPNDLWTAGLEIDIISKSAREALAYVRECEWARYFHDHHPQVGYLMACSTDEVAYKAFNKNLRLQRTLTLMEGSEMCDFRIYALDETANSSE
jgi:hypothetical protein